MAVFKYKDSEGNIKSLINMIGPQGPEGPANNLTIGEVTKGIEAEATITGETPNQVLNLVLPQGDTGVYVGTEEPTNNNVNVWINPEGAETTEIATKDYVDEVIANLEPSIDAVNDKLNKLKMYSTEEIDTGKTWIDGKTIYRKTISLSGVISSIPHNISNLDIVTHIEGIIYRKESVVKNMIFPHNDTDADFLCDLNYVGATNLELICGAKIVSYSTGFIVTLEYTKTN